MSQNLMSNVIEVIIRKIPQNNYYYLVQIARFDLPIFLNYKDIITKNLSYNIEFKENINSSFDDKYKLFSLNINELGRPFIIKESEKKSLIDLVSEINKAGKSISCGATINFNVPLDDKGYNSNIKLCNNMTKERLLQAGFREISKDTGNYFFCKTIQSSKVCGDTYSISFNVGVDLNKNTFKIYTLDEAICQGIDIQRKDNTPYLNKALVRMWDCMSILQEKEILKGWNYGDFI